MAKQVVLSEKYDPLFRWLDAKPGSALSRVNKVIITGGRYSQKSFAVGTWSCVAAKDYNHRILYTRYTLSSAEDSIIPEFEEKIGILNCPQAFVVRKDRISGASNESKIVFKGIKTSSGNQTANLKSLKNFSVFILEEAEEMPDFKSWDKITKSIRAKDVRNLNILILNPTTKEHWIYEEFFESRGVPEGFNGIKDEVLYIHSTYLDIEREYIDDANWIDFEDKRKAYEYYSRLTPREQIDCDPLIRKKANYFKYTILGGWLAKAEGVVFENWSIGAFQEIAPSIFGQDYGFSSDPTTLVRVSIDRGRKKIFCKELLYEPGLRTSQIINKNKQLTNGSLIYADSAEPRLIVEVREGGVNIREALKPPGSLTAGIAMMLDYELVIDPSSLNLIKELNNYVWHDKKSKTPVDAWNHLIDAIRYVVFSTLSIKVVGGRGD
ncbi:phage terminase large subunit [Dyadobacter sp. CY261]|uniref:PBSX family phage terminase large subunit n=1 Tax=Dyadobacter sp. CY261 TaxID=2907203 RepID=UPI001F34D14C|nr:phage terminase large subunit [Dyadobacter sp. CY261]MCF0074041.1 phage terminase large subunit [Dyadobacter sp. CY261]